MHPEIVINKFNISFQHHIRRQSLLSTCSSYLHNSRLCLHPQTREATPSHPSFLLLTQYSHQPLRSDSISAWRGGKCLPPPSPYHRNNAAKWRDTAALSAAQYTKTITMPHGAAQTRNRAYSAVVNWSSSTMPSCSDALMIGSQCKSVCSTNETLHLRRYRMKASKPSTWTL